MLGAVIGDGFWRFQELIAFRNTVLRSNEERGVFDYCMDELVRCGFFILVPEKDDSYKLTQKGFEELYRES